MSIPGIPASTYGTGGGVPVGPQQFIYPNPSVGSSNLLFWNAVTATYKDSAGATQPSIFYDDVGHSTVSAWLDMAGNGADWIGGNGDKALQPAKGANGGPYFSGATDFMECANKSLFNGLSQVSVFALLRPDLGTTARTLLYSSESVTSGNVISGAIASGGTGHAVNDYLTQTGGTASAQAIFKVTAVSGGVITAIKLINPGAYTVFPSNPVTVTSSGAGTGATINSVNTTIGSGSATDRSSFYMSSTGSGRKPFVTFSPSDGTAVTSANAPTSVGPANGSTLNDTTTLRRVGYVCDLAGGTYQPYYQGAADGPALTISAGPTGTADSVFFRIGNNGGTPPNRALNMEIVALMAFSEVPNSTRLAAIENSLANLGGL